MDVIAGWCGFVGAWILVAGPIYQGAVELSEVKVDRSAVKSQAEAVPPARPISPWWWLLPPIAYILTTRHQAEWREQVMESLSAAQREEFVTYSNKAVGWFVVGAGAALIGIKEAAELGRALHWPVLVTPVLAVTGAAVAVAFTVRRMHLTRRALHGGEQT